MAKTNGVPDCGAVQLIDNLLARAIARRASDVHFEPEDGLMRVRYRLDGLLQDVDRLPGAMAEGVIARLKVLAGLLTYRVDVPQEGSFALVRPLTRRAALPLSNAEAFPSCQGLVASEKTYDQAPSTSHQALGPDPQALDLPPIDVRVATFPTVRGERAVVRLLYTVGPVNGLEGLGLRDEMLAGLRQAAERPHGLILVTGPAGSGKSTTLYALARHILAATPGRSVVSLEDPVEQRISGMAQIQVSPHGELNYLRAMRSLLRQDVEVLLVGEIRDAGTAHVVVESALTGHLIMSTMHSGDPAEALARLLEMGIEPYQVVSAVTAVCSQRLLRTVCPACAASPQADGKTTCEACAGTGYVGRTACGQLAVMNDDLRQAVLLRSPTGQLRRLIHTAGPDLAADARRLELAGRTTREEVLRVLGER